MPKTKKKTKAQRSALAAARRLARNKVCEGCRKRFGTVFDKKQHVRVCDRAKELAANKALAAKHKSFKSKVAKQELQTRFKMLGHTPGSQVLLRGKKRKPKAAVTTWESFYAYAKGRVVQLWGTVHPVTGNFCVCLKKWPSKCEIELWFGMWGPKARDMFDEKGKVLDRWGASVEFL